MRSSILTHKRAKALRRDLTQPEQTLWSLLRRNRLGLHFRRQHALGPYILDFYCASAEHQRLAERAFLGSVGQSAKKPVEVDGPAHAERAEHDARRNAWLAGQGIRTLRFPVEAVELRPAVVLASIAEAARAAGG